MIFYESGEPVSKGDRIRYRGEDGTVEFTVSKDDCGDRDPYLDDFPNGGVMLSTSRLGRVFVPLDQLNEEDIELLSDGTTGNV